MSSVAEEVTHSATTALESVKAVESHASPTKRQTPRWRRANVLVGRVIVALIVLLIVKGWQTVFSILTPYVAEVHHKPRLAFAYSSMCRALFMMLIYTFLMITLAPRGHSRPPYDPPRAIMERSVVHEVSNFDADLPRCWQDGCKGAWIPPRARHCRDCGFCTLAFDHCCPFFGPSCISGTKTLKPFLLFLLSAAALIFVGAVPLFPLVRRHLKVVLATSWNAEHVHEVWWSKWRSWLAGPVWRYGGGLIVAYRHHHSLGQAYDHPALRPTLTPLFVLVFAVFVFLIAETMLGVSFANLLTGRTTLEIERIKRSKRAKGSKPDRYVWIPYEPPSPGSDDPVWGGSVLRIPLDAPLYDLGRGQNWRSALGERWIGWLNPHHSPCDGIIWPVNKAYTAKLREQAMKDD